MVKADGCVAVHADGGAYKPLNWMNAPNRLVIDTDAGVWRVTAPGRSDSLVIRIEEILHDSTHEMGTRSRSAEGRCRGADASAPR